MEYVITTRFKTETGLTTKDGKVTSVDRGSLQYLAGKPFSDVTKLVRKRLRSDIPLKLYVVDKAGCRHEIKVD